MVLPLPVQVPAVPLEDDEAVAMAAASADAEVEDAEVEEVAEDDAAEEAACHLSVSSLAM